MIYNVTRDFVKINETNGTISGILLTRLDKCSFSGTKYIRCIGGNAEVRVVTFVIDASGGSSSTGSIDCEHFADDNDMEAAIDDIFG